MTRDFLIRLRQQYATYVDSFRDVQGGLPELLQLKLDHTHRVVEDARQIMVLEKWDEMAFATGEACALLHDTARYSQLVRFGTFRDSESFDHAVEAVSIIHRNGWLASLAPVLRKKILTSVAVHNKREVPASLSGVASDLAWLVRDADKLDIFRLLEQAVKDGSLERNPEIAWGLQVQGAPNPDLVAAVTQGHSVSYTWVKTLSDFVLIQIGWLNGGLHFDSAVRLAFERQALEFRVAFLKTLSQEHELIEQCCAAAKHHQTMRLGRLAERRKAEEGHDG